mgnify:CR=1 FL=1
MDSAVLPKQNKPRSRKMKTFDIDANGTPMGEYKGETLEEAIDAYASDAGYSDFDDMAQEVGATKEELAINEIDSEKLVEAVEKASGFSVCQDTPVLQDKDEYDGVVLVDGVRYRTYRELAEAFGLSVDDFFR